MLKKPTIKHTIQGIVFTFPYNKWAVAAVKRIPSNLRRWEPNSKCWIVAESQKAELIRICQFHFNNEYDVVGSPVSSVKSEIKLFKVMYISALKDYGDGNQNSLACGFTGDYNMLFSEAVLKDWFECGIGGLQNDKPKTGKTTLYAALAIGRNANGIEIKQAYRKAARRFHPDVNSDDDAAEMFIKIQAAYERLKNPLSRRRYDAGLVFEADTDKQSSSQDAWLKTQVGAYRPPQRCGWVMCEGKNEVGRFVVSKILKWELIIKNDLELVTSWDNVAKEIKQEWV